MPSPCVLVCAVDGQTGWCLGCGRALGEIAQWTKLTDPERRLVVDQLPERLSKLQAAGKLGGQT